VNDHEVIRLDLPAYAASRLEEPTRARLEQHVRVCAECREMIETLRGLGDTLRDGGESLFAPHPNESTLREYAGLGPGTGPEGIARHLADCATCSLEVDYWTRRSRSPRMDRLFSARRSRWGAVALASAAGLAAGFLLAVLLRAGGVPATPPPTARSATDAATAVGRLLVLPRALRGEGATTSYDLDPNQAFVVIACPAPIPETADAGERYLYEIRNAAGETVWSRTMTAAGIRHQMTGGVDVVTLLVPLRSLAPGRYEFRLLPATGPSQPLYHAVLELTGSGESSN
jgi:hypothetical protein